MELLLAPLLLCSYIPIGTALTFAIPSAPSSDSSGQLSAARYGAGMILDPTSATDQSVNHHCCGDFSDFSDEQDNCY
jgi:hypothetical protein